VCDYDLENEKVELVFDCFDKMELSVLSAFTCMPSVCLLPVY